MLCMALVFCMVVIGGLTRLTESGLSIVEWKLFSGILPPLTHESWEAEFTAYQASPEFRIENQGMSLGDFQGIFWLEYLHRLLGRLIGMVVLIPLVFIWFSPNVARWFRWRMSLVALLVGLQGTVGWYMVKSGLVDVPWVSPYRLALHLGLAVSLFGLLVATWLRLDESIPQRMMASPTSRTLMRLSKVALLVLFLQILFGAFVAGLDAGFTYNTFPLMDGDFFPPSMWQLSPLPRNLFENIATVQFIHRWWAFIATAFVLLTAFCVWRQTTLRSLRYLCVSLSVTVIAQVVLGITTLLMVVPTSYAAAHQALAVVLFGQLLALCYYLQSSQESDSSSLDKPTDAYLPPYAPPSHVH